MFLLSLHLRTEGEVREKLEGRGYTSDTVKTVIIRLMDQKYLDDQRYAEVFLENLKQYKNFGFYGIKKKFIEKKLPSSIIETVLADGLPVEEEIKIAKRFLKKEGVAVTLPPDNAENQYSTFDEEKSKNKQRLSQKLKAKGFRGEVVARVLF
jgi:regulatory protein